MRDDIKYEECLGCKYDDCDTCDAAGDCNHCPCSSCNMTREGMNNYVSN